MNCNTKGLGSCMCTTGRRAVDTSLKQKQLTRSFELTQDGRVRLGNNATICGHCL